MNVMMKEIAEKRKEMEEKISSDKQRCMEEMEKDVEAKMKAKNERMMKDVDERSTQEIAFGLEVTATLLALAVPFTILHTSALYPLLTRLK